MYKRQVEILSPISKGLLELISIATVGLFITLAVLADEVKGKITDTKLVARTRKLLLSWILALCVFVVVQISYLLEQPLRNSFNLTVIRSYLTQTSIGKTYLLQLIIVLFTLMIPMRRISAAYFSSVIGLIAIVAPVFQSHGSSSGHHALAIGALVVHVSALCLWVGGLIGLAQLDAKQRKIALPRFSQIALWSAIAVAISLSLIHISEPTRRS